MRQFLASGRAIRSTVFSVVLDAVASAIPAPAQSLSDALVAAYSLLASIGKLTVAHLGLDTGLAPVSGSGALSYYEGVRNRNFG